jgi:hypothetical protein
MLSMLRAMLSMVRAMLGWTFITAVIRISRRAHENPFLLWTLAESLS